MAMKFNVQKAVREKISVKIALMGSSGCGKSYSALRLASGMASEIEKTTGESVEVGKYVKIFVGGVEKDVLFVDGENI